MTDARKAVAEQVAAAFARGTPLEIRGGGGKRFYGHPPADGMDVLETAGLSGVAAYEPSELFFCAGAGTSLAEAERILAGENQMLAFEPPHFGAADTLGGAAACGLSGPRRPFAGAVRDFILGAEMADGRGALLRFGGRVIKNVAGFDLSRLCAGAMGTLGVLTELTFRVAPRPESELTTTRECDAKSGIVLAAELLGRGLPLTATAWSGGVLHVRLSGASASAARAAQMAGGDILPESAGRDFWESIRNHRHNFFTTGENGGESLWRVGCAPLSSVSGDSQLIEWRGAVRWFRGSRRAAERFARECGGHLTLFRAGAVGVVGVEGAEEGGVFPRMSPAVWDLHRRLKAVFDPADILNRGRLHDFSSA